MKPFTRTTSLSPGRFSALTPLAAVLIGLAAAGCGPSPAPDPDDDPQVTMAITDIARLPRPPYSFGAEDEALLDEIQRASFKLFWEGVSPDTGMVYDRTSSDVISVAGVGFQLAAIPIAVERGWVTRSQGQDRVLKILRALQSEPTNRKEGLFYHFLEPHDAAPRRVGAELVVSTIDSAVLFAGMLSAGVYFEGEAREIADQLFAEANWSFFLQEPGADGAPPGRFMSLGWRPSDDNDPTGDGERITYSWLDSGDEHRLVTFMGVAATNPEYRLDPEIYYALRRQLGTHDTIGKVVWFPYSGALFTAFFAHCFIDYAHMGVDNPGAMTDLPRIPVDWWENSRRLVNLHRARAIENPDALPTFGVHAWGLTASDSPGGYLVAGHFPDRIEMPGAVAGRDFSTYVPTERWGDGTIAPYAAGASIMFEPDASLDALRHYRALKNEQGEPLVWRDPGRGGYGFADAFNLSVPGKGMWAAPDDVAIDHGPMLLGIENARAALIWRLFSGHPAVRGAEQRLRLR